MSEVTRTCRCPECSLPFLIKFESEQPLGGTLVRVGCPRCAGFIRTHVPTSFNVVAAETRPSRSTPAVKGLSA